MIGQKSPRRKAGSSASVGMIEGFFITRFSEMAELSKVLLESKRVAFQRPCKMILKLRLQSGFDFEAPGFEERLGNVL